MTLPVPAEPDPGYIATVHAAAAHAVEIGAGVALWTVVNSVRDDGHHDLADAITRDMIDRIMAKAANDPTLFARLLHMLRETP